MGRYLIPLILVVSAVSLYFFQTAPYVEHIRVQSKVKEERVSLRDKADEIRAVRNTIRDEQLAQITPQERDRLNRLLPDAIDNVRLIIDVENIARKYGMIPRVRSFVQDDKSGTGASVSLATRSYNTVTFAFSVSGSYDTLQRFTRNLEQSLRLVDIKKIEFKTEDSDYYEYDIEIETYWLKEL